MHDKMPNDDLIVILHETIDHNLETASNLQLVSEFPIHILATIAGIGAIVAYSE